MTNFTLMNDLTKGIDGYILSWLRKKNCFLIKLQFASICKFLSLKTFCHSGLKPGVMQVNGSKSAINTQKLNLIKNKEFFTIIFFNKFNWNLSHIPKTPLNRNRSENPINNSAQSFQYSSSIPLFSIFNRINLSNDLIINTIDGKASGWDKRYCRTMEENNISVGAIDRFSFSFGFYWVGCNIFGNKEIKNNLMNY